MNEFLNALKADFLDRRLLPFIALVVVALAAAIGYVVTSGGSSSSTPTASGPAVSAQTGATHLTINQITPEKAVAEVPTGASKQREGSARDPFAPVVYTKAATTSAKTAAGGGSASSSKSSATTTTPSPETKGKEPAKPAPTKPKSKVVYHVAALFGQVPAVETTPPTQLTPFVNIPLLTPLPSVQEPLLVFRGVTTGGKSATFTVVGEVILHGNATCLPSPQQCEAIDLQVGKSERLEYIPPSGPVQLYELRIVSISAASASAASVRSFLRSESRAGRELLRRSGLVSIPYLHYSSPLGVLAFATRGGFSARAHGARRR
jgi:hypothetical protein